MPFKGTEFLDVAHQLAQNHPEEEAFARTSISRAYYAAFHSARDYCQAMGVDVSGSNAHIEARWCLEANGRHSIAADLRILHDWRKQADYDVPFPQTNLSRTVTSALARADILLNRLNTLPQ
jgi:uncharacterized protein (UPF0332 family)